MTQSPGQSTPSTTGIASIQATRPSKPMVFDCSRVTRHRHQTVQPHSHVINSLSTGSQPPPITMYMQGHEINQGKLQDPAAIKESNLTVNWASPTPLYNINASKRGWWQDPVAQQSTNSNDRLQPPTLASMGNLVMGAESNKHWLQNRRRRHKLQDQYNYPWHFGQLTREL